MSIEILMPALSPTMLKGRLSKWFVKPGDSIRAGDVIAEIETDKATMEVESVDEGCLGKILVSAGTDDVPVNVPIAILLSEGEDLGDITSGRRKPDVCEKNAPRSNHLADASQVAPSSPVSLDARSFRAAPVYSSVQKSSSQAIIPGESWLDGVKTSQMTVREALRKAIAEEMHRDPEVFIMGEEVAEYQGAYKVTEGLLQEFGSKRVIDTPITEPGFTGLGVGAAMAGLKPIVEFMTFNFSMQAIDQIINSAAKSRYMSGGQIACPIVFRGPNGPAARVAAQHSQDFSAWYSHVPGLKVVHPYSGADAKGLLKAAIRDPDPVVFLENEILYGHTFPVPDSEDWIVPIGRARIVRLGRDVTLVSWGIGMSYALQAADRLAADGIDVEVIDMRTLRPMDSDIVIRSVMKTGYLVCVEEGWPQCSVSSEVCMRVIEEAFDYLDAPPVRVTGKDVPMPYAANLENLARPTVDDVVAAVRSVTYRG